MAVATTICEYEMEKGYSLLKDCLDYMDFQMYVMMIRCTSKII